VLPFLPHGKGIWIRRISACENGELDTLVAKAEAAHYTHVFLKIADGSDAYNLDPLTQRDRAVDLTVKLHAVGLDVWGWHNIYGDKPLFKGPPSQANYHLREAECAVQRVKRLQAAGLRGYVIAPEGEYKRILDRAEKAAQFMESVRQGLGDFPIGLTSWKQPSAHRSFPWEAFRSRCDLDLPQVFWIGRHGEAVRQLETSFKQFNTLRPRLPYLPAGPAFFEDNWRPSPEEIMAFLEKALALGVPAASLWDWDHLGLTEESNDNPERLDFREHWQAAADFGWSVKAEEVTTEDGRRKTDEATALRPTPEPEAASTPTIVRQPEIGTDDGRRRTEEAPAPEPTPEHLTPEHLTLEHLILVEPETEDELPEWLEFLNAPEAETLIQPAPTEVEPDFAVEIEDEEELPEWLQFLNESQAPIETNAPSPEETELVSPADQETEEALPEWLQFTSQSKPELPFETPLAASEPTPEPAPAFTAEPISEAAKTTEPEPPQTDLAPVASEEPSVPEVSQSEEPEPPQTDFAPVASEEPSEPAFTFATETTPEVSQPEEAELPSTDFAPVPSEEPSEPAFAVTAESLPEVSKPEEIEPPQSDSVPGPTATKAPKPIFFTPASPPASTRGVQLPKRAVARVASTASLIPREDTVSRFFDALRNGEPELAVTFYGPGFAHVNSDRVEHDPATLTGFYAALLEQIEGQELGWSTIPMTRAIVNVKWNTLTRAGKSLHGTDTFHLNPAGQIVYHHTSFRIENGATS